MAKNANPRCRPLSVFLLAVFACCGLVGGAEAGGGAGLQTSDTFGVGERIPTFPRDSSAFSCNISAASVSFSGGILTATIGATGRIQCSDYTYTCDTGSCEIVDQEVTRGTVRRESTGGGGTNRPPRATGSVPAQTLRLGGGSASVNVSRYFTDPDGDRLTYTARSSRSGVVRASASGSTVTLTPVAAGTTTVTVTARDPDGESATQSIAVTVEEDGGTSDTFGVGERIPTFPRGSAALSGSLRNASVQLSGGVATVTIGAGGYARYSDYTYTCTVSECVIVDQEVRRGIVRRESSGGGTNRPPRATGSIPARTLTVGSAAVSVNVAPYFTDPDGDALTYSASSNRSGIVRARASGSTVTLTPGSPGTATVAVTARDSGGLSATQSIAVTVQAAGGVGGFTDDPLVPGVTPVRAVHFRELRTRIDELRTGAGLSTYAWTDPVLTPGVTRVRSVHVTDLRTALNQAYAAAGQPRPAYRDAGVRAGTTPIRAAHLTELRAAVVELENAAPTGLMPDLVVGSPTVTDSTLTPGQSFTLSATVSNRGSARAAATTLRYYRSTNSTISSSDTAVGTDRVSALAAGASGAESIGLTAPSSAGTYYYGACVEPVGEESDTDNNCSSGVRVTVESGGGGTGNCTNDLGTVSGTVTRTASWDGSCPSVHYSNGEYARYYTFTLRQRAAVRIDLTSPSVDTWLALRNGAGTGTGLIESDDDDGTGTNARISRTLAAGTYTIEATTLRGGVTGPFTLTMTVQADGGGTDGLEVDLTKCTGEPLAGDLIRIEMEGTVRARRGLTDVVVRGWVGDYALAFPDRLGNMAAGQTKSFSLTDIVDADRIGAGARCRVEVTARTSSGDMTAETATFSEELPIR